MFREECSHFGYGPLPFCCDKVSKRPAAHGHDLQRRVMSLGGSSHRATFHAVRQPQNRDLQLRRAHLTHLGQPIFLLQEHAGLACSK